MNKNIKFNMPFEKEATKKTDEDELGPKSYYAFAVILAVSASLISYCFWDALSKLF